ncbi:FAD dependent oxidoreductase [Mesorhizobium albiziae]|uniref:FAD dependent oxidoreductase n=1 Tax=Neomesorhizobium albiziae TaxID=335020 RepID=A0A1I4FPI4_9HYPH|nr:FAD dependent oxidoreductase [Mesorhizobium albiziae]
MTRRLLIIGGGIQGMMSASAAAKAGAFSEIIVTEQAFGSIGASHYSGGVHFPYGRQHRTRSLTRKSAVALAAMAGSDVTGWYRPLAMRVAAGPDEAIDPAQFTEPLDAAGPHVGSLAPSFSDRTRFWNIGGAHVADVPALIAQLERELVAKIRMAHGLRCVRLRERLPTGTAASSIACSAVNTMQTYRIDRSLRAWTISPLRRTTKPCNPPAAERTAR